MTESSSSFERLPPSLRGKVFAQAQALRAAGANPVPVSAWQAAVHEAGHATMCAAFGASVRSVSIYPVRGLPTDWAGWHEFDPPAGWHTDVLVPGGPGSARLGTPFGLVAEAMIVWAGPAAEFLFIPQARNPWNALNDKPERLRAEGLCSGGLVLSCATGPMNVAEASDVQKAVRPLMQGFEMHCADLLTDNAQHIKALAEKLKSHRRLARHEVASVLRHLPRIDTETLVQRAIACADRARTVLAHIIKDRDAGTLDHALSKYAGPGSFAHEVTSGPELTADMRRMVLDKHLPDYLKPLALALSSRGAAGGD